MTIKITNNGAGQPAGKLAEAELHFDDGAGILSGLRLIGFSIWRRIGGGQHVTFPSRKYTVGNCCRTFALLRPISSTAPFDAVRDQILAAYAVYAARAGRLTGGADETTQAEGS